MSVKKAIVLLACMEEQLRIYRGQFDKALCYEGKDKVQTEDRPLNIETSGIAVTILTLNCPILPEQTSENI